MGGNPLAAVANMVDQITEQYPAFAPLLQIPEVAKLLIEASAPGHQWTTAKLQAAIKARTGGRRPARRDGSGRSPN